MGNSTITLESVYDTIAAQNIFDPRLSSSGYGDGLGLDLASRVMADIITERFNQKFNRITCSPFMTNALQQDYPQPAQASGAFGWGEDCDLVDINSTQVPSPIYQLSVVRGLSRSSVTRWQPSRICWMYNSELSLGTWPGPNTKYAPLVTSGPIPNNPAMSLLDANGNILILTGFGVTGAEAPQLAANAAEGATVNDGTCVWSVVSGGSQGFRLNYLPNQTTSWQIIPYAQKDPPRFTTFAQKLDPIPDSFSRHFYTGLESYCLQASKDERDVKRGQQKYAQWIRSLEDAVKQGNKEVDSYGLLPASPVADDRWSAARGYSADNPFGM